MPREPRERPTMKDEPIFRSKRKKPKARKAEPMVARPQLVGRLDVKPQVPPQVGADSSEEPEQ